MNPSPAPRALIDDATAATTITAFAVSALGSLVNFAALFPRAFPNHFIANDSAIRFMSQRCRLLLLASALLFVDAGRNIVQYYFIWQFGTSYHFLVNRIIGLLSFPWTAPLLTHGTCQRCAVIISKQPEQQLRLIRISKSTCLTIALVTVAGGITTLVSLIQNDASTSAWFLSPDIPLLFAWPIAAYPLLAVLSTCWALSCSVRASNTKTPPASGGSQATQDAPSAPKGKGSTLSSANVPKSSSSLSTLRKPTFMAGSLANVSTRFTSRQRASSNQGAGQLYYPLSTTFVILSVANVLLWIIVIYGGTAGTWSGKLRNHALMNLVATWAVSVETSFEYLVRKVAKRQAAASQRQSENGSSLGFGFTTNGGVSVCATSATESAAVPATSPC